MNRRLRLEIWALVGMLLIALTGCGKPSPPVTFYNLAPVVAAPSIQSPGDTPLCVGVGPVRFPESLRRAQIAVRINEQSVRFDEFHRWSGSLEEDFSRIFLEDLAAVLPDSAHVIAYPWKPYFELTHRVQLDVRQFDGSPGGDVQLETRWVVTSGDGKALLQDGKLLISIPVTGSEIAQLVAAQSAAVAALARDIAAVLEQY